MRREEIYLVDLWHVFRREWLWMLAALVLAGAAAWTFTHTAKRQWEASAWIQIGQVGVTPQGQDPKIEPLQRVLERLQMASFQNDVLASLKIPLNSPEAGLYRKSVKLEPLPYAGPMVKVNFRAYSPDEARQLAEATVAWLHAVHAPLQARAMTWAQQRVRQVDDDLRAARAERAQLASAATDRVSAGVSTVVLSIRNEEIRALEALRSDLEGKLGSAYTFETSLAWPVYVPEHPVFPNVVLSWGMALLLGLALGACLMSARDAMRRRRLAALSVALR